MRSMRGTLRRSRWRWLLCIALAPLCRVAFALDCSDPLFTCESERASKYISICATEVQPGSKWEDIQYRFGAENQKPELVFPADASKGASMMYFSHVKRGSDYRVSVRFSIGSYTYRVLHHGPRSSGSFRYRQARKAPLDRSVHRTSVYFPPTFKEPCPVISRIRMARQPAATGPMQNANEPAPAAGRAALIPDLQNVIFSEIEGHDRRYLLLRTWCFSRP